jgi:chromosome segregation ATPase
LQTQLSERDENILKVERERDAFRERLGAVEAQRQLSMEQYQDEVETSVLAVTNQLEELLELNQQLQKELNNTQMEKEQLIICIDNGNTTREREKIHYQQEIANYECKLNQLTRELEQVKANSQQKVSSVVSKREQELQKQLDNVKKENENLSLELENSQLETSHQVTSLKQEKQSLLHKMGSLQAQYTKMKIDSKRMEEELVSVRKELSECQQVKASSEAHLITTRNELSNVHEQVGQLKMQLNELRDVSLPHSRQQVENLTQQLVQKSHQLQKADDEKRQLSNKVKKMENKIHELTLSQQNGASDLSTMTLDYKSIQSQLEVTQNINDQLEHKILTYENEINEWKKMALENQTQVDELSELIKLKDAEIKELENNGQTLKQALDKGNEHHSLEMTIAALRKENETLDVRLKAELERNKVIAQTERRLSEENSKLRDVLNDSLSLNDKLQSSMDSSQVKMNSLKLSPVRPHSSHTSPRSPSAADEISRLKQELSEAHQTCLQLDRQQEQDKTEMSKVQGSLQALVKIQDHLRRENKSLGETLLNLEEEKDKFRQEAKRLQHELIASQESLKRINSSIGAFIKYSTSQLEKMMEQDDRIVSLLTECQRSTGKDFEVPKKVFDVLSVLVMEKSSQVARLQMEMESLHEKANKDDEGNREHIVQMQEKLSNMNEELSVMRKEMEKRNNELEERDKELAALQFTMIQEDSIRTKSEECLKKDLETQYQVIIICTVAAISMMALLPL